MSGLILGDSLHPGIIPGLGADLPSTCSTSPSCAIRVWLSLTDEPYTSRSIHTNIYSLYSYAISGLLHWHPTRFTTHKRTTRRLRAWIRIYIHNFLWDVIIHPCHIVNGGLANSFWPWHGFVITFTLFYEILYILIHILAATVTELNHHRS